MTAYENLKTFEDLGDKVVVYGIFGEPVVLNSLEWGVEWEEFAVDFKAQFKVRDGQTFGKEGEQYFNKVTFIRLIERLSDGQLFGYTYSEEISGDGEIFLKANGAEHGYGAEAYVFLPVKPFTMTGYEVATA